VGGQGILRGGDEISEESGERCGGGIGTVERGGGGPVEGQTRCIYCLFPR